MDQERRKPLPALAQIIPKPAADLYRITREGQSAASSE
jgi:hypothetical protein